MKLHNNKKKQKTLGIVGPVNEMKSDLKTFTSFVKLSSSSKD